MQRRAKLIRQRLDHQRSGRDKQAETTGREINLIQQRLRHLQGEDGLADSSVDDTLSEEPPGADVFEPTTLLRPARLAVPTLTYAEAAEAMSARDKKSERNEPKGEPSKATQERSDPQDDHRGPAPKQDPPVEEEVPRPPPDLMIPGLRPRAENMAGPWDYQRNEEQEPEVVVPDIQGNPEEQLLALTTAVAEMNRIHAADRVAARAERERQLQRLQYQAHRLNEQNELLINTGQDNRRLHNQIIQSQVQVGTMNGEIRAMQAQRNKPYEGPTRDKHRLEAFTDNTGDVQRRFEEWTAKFIRTMRGNKWNEEDAKNHLILNIGYPASQSLVNIVEDGKTFKELLDDVRDRITPAKASFIAETDFRSAEQKKDETVQIWYGRIQDLHRRAYPDQDPDKDKNVINTFIGGLVNALVQREVVRAQPTSLAQAFRVAIREVASIIHQYQLNITHKSAHTHRNLNLAGDLPEKYKDSVASEARNSTSRGRRQANSVGRPEGRPDKDPERRRGNSNEWCTYCKCRGHSTDNCRSKKAAENRAGKKPPPKVNALAETDHEDPDYSSDHYDEPVSHSSTASGN